MSSRNSQANKAAARERLRAEREAQAKKARARRQVFVGAGVVGILAVAGLIGYGVVQANQPGYWEKAAKAELVKPKNTSGENGTTVVVGKADAKKTLELYEDSRCPACASFEQSVGEQVKKDVADGKYKLQYFGATFIDNAMKGEGSKNALSALGAALNVSPEAFLEYKGALYSKELHPEETADSFAKDDYLLKVADTVPALKGNAEFKKAVEDGTYDRWAMEMSKAFGTSGVTGTPTLKMDGKKIETPATPEAFTAALDKAIAG
ncbi:DsbA family protein [Streptomyces subrutilus]|uniref:DSBA oxidoreductase n=1 Tax=Streptomyces subrutilus TaxID=36818 RepID=A0A5P2UW98_9ACTN|nr:DsbA family protein [Streptomyces subrutilus]QEU81007.1 DsbA family protein [Streptomyces subrutilus]WSJ29686.1 DsbA family protein [Streptomyces subrutilus]GGZ66412.1 DSBA oxidoreductase [Streptomyces subrutilus]